MEKELVIIIAHYNYPEGLELSLNSIRENIDVDVIIVDDGSDSKPDIDGIRRDYSNGNIYYDELSSNQGVGVAANRGLELAQEMGYRLIGRLDCGDICYPHKYEKQLKHLNENQDVMLLGTCARVVDEDGTFLHMLKFPTQYEEIKKKMYFNSMFLNPSVVFRTEVISEVGNYPYKYRRASQDYAFFFNVVEKYKSENLPDVLMDYVVESHSISTTKRRLQVKNRIKVVLEHFYWGYYPIAGLMRGVFLYFLPRHTTTFFKRILKRKA
ncbi:MAG: glycosyltransferase [Flavobacteriaceae bacterium]|nr:glycosyltransferase [Flavobacteriaceae bacterium]